VSDARPGWLLDGRVRHDQPESGHRTALEPVLLAASIPAKAGERVLEAGTGSGAALLCLAARVPGLTGLGIERDATLATLAQANFSANGFAGLRALCADIADARPDGVFDHAFANPPWHDPAGTPSPRPAREAARRTTPGLFGLWAARLATTLRHRGTLSVVVAAPSLPDCLRAFADAGCGSPVLLPLWPKPGRDAKLVILRGVKGGRGPFRLSPGLVLHRDDGAFSAGAAAVLRDGAALEF
jgi:tRNA1(Val) A37 N6-methylase TrmN6